MQDVVADMGYYSADVLGALAEETTCRTYISEPQLPAGQRRTWTDKPAGQRQAVYANRRRGRCKRGRRLQRQRSERVERTFAHVCETGGARRTWLRGIDKVRKRYLLAAAAHNLGCLMRELFGKGTPRGLQGAAALVAVLLRTLWQLQITLPRLLQLLMPARTRYDSISTNPKLRRPEIAFATNSLHFQRAARELVKRIEWSYTPKHGSWHNIAENELSCITRQCVNGRRIASIEFLAREIAAWSKDVNAKQRGVDWQMRIDDARFKLKSVYPKIRT